jgi:hypothetical protein
MSRSTSALDRKRQHSLPADLGVPLPSTQPKLDMEIIAEAGFEADCTNGAEPGPGRATSCDAASSTNCSTWVSSCRISAFDWVTVMCRMAKDARMPHGIRITPQPSLYKGVRGPRWASWRLVPAACYLAAVGQY